MPFANSISLASRSLPICEAFFAAGAEIGIPRNRDFTGESQDGAPVIGEVVPDKFDWRFFSVRNLPIIQVQSGKPVVLYPPEVRQGDLRRSAGLKRQGAARA